MPVIDNLKNFIRHGKAARDSDNHNTSPPSQAQVHPAEISGQSHAPISGGSSSNQQVGYIPERSTGSQPQPSNTTAKGQASQHSPSSSSAQQAASAAAAASTNSNMNSSSNNKKSKDEYSQQAQQIVDEEREASEKMPYHEGLSERFELISKMGDGAFSNVYKARDRKTGALVAVKVVRKYELNSSQSADGRLDPQFRKKNRVTERANILKEVQIMRNLKHDGIVELLEFSESREHYFLVLELLKGGELFHQIVKLTYFSEPLSRHVILQVANGIRYLHEERGVVHRDIKPENLLFESIKIIPSKIPKARPYDEEKEDEGEFMPGIGGGGIGKVKIADFGLSKVVWEESTMTPCGTVGYTAPEIVKDERYSKSVDMWALGCVLYTLLCGFPPFYDESISVLTEKVAKGYYTFLSPWWDDISDSAKDLITHLLCVDSSKRYTIDEFLAHPWCNVQDPVPNLDSAEILLAKTSEMPLDSPLLQSMKRGNAPSRQAMMSPGIHQLKEAFDVTYAVHRMEEEGRHRQKNAGNNSQALGGLNEEEEEDETDLTRRKYGNEAAKAVEQTQRSSRTSQSSQQKAQPQQQQQQQQQQHYQGRGGADRKLAEAALYEGRAGTRDRGSNSSSKKRAFELNMGNATLLGRRNKGGAMGLQSSIDGAMSNSLGSPMRVD